MYPLIIALDVNILKALDVVKELKDEVVGYKVGWDLIFEGSISIISEVSRYGDLIVDLKIADVPHIALKLIEKLIKRGACCVIVHGFLNPSVPKGPSTYVLVKMTTPTLYDQMWERLVEEIKDVRGYVLPGNEPLTIRKVREKIGCRYRIISPGIGPQGGKPGDALKAGADFEIVGRYVLEDPSRVSEWSGYRPTCYEKP
ncbi:MAG: orotidine 5'-phosphate decarboxylase / HUMPS family protein [Pyrobaculum sp.]